MSTWYKQGVFGQLQPPAAEGLRFVEKLFHTHSEDLFITSLQEGTHCPGSLHPSGLAWDMRLPSFPVGEISEVLGPFFDVVIESNHVHVEFDPPLTGGDK